MMILLMRIQPSHLDIQPRKYQLANRQSRYDREKAGLVECQLVVHL